MRNSNFLKVMTALTTSIQVTPNLWAMPKANEGNNKFSCEVAHAIGDDSCFKGANILGDDLNNTL